MRIDRQHGMRGRQHFQKSTAYTRQREGDGAANSAHNEIAKRDTARRSGIAKGRNEWGNGTAKVRPRTMTTTRRLAQCRMRPWKG